MNAFMTRRRLWLIVVGVCLVTALGPVIVADAANLTWDFKYTDITFNWTGTWDKTAYWAYGMAVFNVYDWSYLFGWYGQGWDKLSPLSTAPSGKLHYSFYEEANSGVAGYSQGMDIKFNMAYMDALDTSSTKWAGQVLHYGQVLTHECSHGIFGAYLGSRNPDNGSNGGNWLTESLARYAADNLWAWGKGEWDQGNWAPLYNLADVTANYKRDFNRRYSGGALTLSDCGLTYRSDIKYRGDKFENVISTFSAVGYYLSTMTHSDGKSDGIYNNAYLLQNLRVGYSLSDAFARNWGGVTLNQYANSTTNKNDFYYYFYHNYWG